METLNRQETEDLIIDLYHNKKKTFREIQKIVRKSPRDISAVLNRLEPERSSLSISSQAYKLFSECKTPIQVAIMLNLKEPEARQFYLEYWNLQHLYDLYRIYQEIKTNIVYFVNLYKSAVASGFDIKHVIRLLGLANNDLRAVEYRYQKLIGEEASLKAGNRNAARTFQQLSDDISEEHKILDQYSSFCKQQRQEINKISLQKIGLERYIEGIQNHNDVYLKIKEAIKQEIKFILTEPRQLLKAALESLIESFRINPRRFYAFCYNKNIATPTTTEWATQPSSAIDDDNGQHDYLSSENEQLLHPDFCNSDENYEKMLLDQAENLYNKIINDLTSKMVCDAIGKSMLSMKPEGQPLYPERKSSEKILAFLYRKEENSTFIQSEIGNKEGDQGN